MVLSIVPDPFSKGKKDVSMKAGETMLQFYLMSVLINALAGYTLFFGDEAPSDDTLDFRCGFSVKGETYRLAIGIIAAFTGLFKLLSSVQGDLPVIGDIVPAAAGFLCGFILILEYLNDRSEDSGDSGPVKKADGLKADGFLIANKKLIGAAAMVSAVLHFLFPTVLLL